VSCNHSASTAYTIAGTVPVRLRIPGPAAMAAPRKTTFLLVLFHRQLLQLSGEHIFASSRHSVLSVPTRAISAFHANVLGQNTFWSFKETSSVLFRTCPPCHSNRVAAVHHSRLGFGYAKMLSSRPEAESEAVPSMDLAGLRKETSRQVCCYNPLDLDSGTWVMDLSIWFLIVRCCVNSRNW
jgi:hypothetical protein